MNQTVSSTLQVAGVRQSSEHAAPHTTTEAVHSLTCHLHMMYRTDATQEALRFSEQAVYRGNIQAQRSNLHDPLGELAQACFDATKFQLC